MRRFFEYAQKYKRDTFPQTFLNEAGVTDSTWFNLPDNYIVKVAVSGNRYAVKMVGAPTSVEKLLVWDSARAGLPGSTSLSVLVYSAATGILSKAIQGGATTTAAIVVGHQRFDIALTGVAVAVSGDVAISFPEFIV